MRKSAGISAIHVIDLADALRRNAQACGADLNAANLFVHEVLMRALACGVRFETLAQAPERRRAAYLMASRPCVTATRNFHSPSSPRRNV